MRSFLVGLLFLALSGSAFGQATGFVESIGFGRAYRPDCWTPMVVNLTSTLGEPANYKVQVIQPDMDGDKVVYEKVVTLNAGVQEKYWVYFRPRPTGLNFANVPDLQKALRVQLSTEKTNKFITDLRLTTGLVDFDPPTSFAQGRRGKKMILAVVAAQKPSWRDYQDAVGLAEDVEFIEVSPAELPENELGYDAVDAVVWFDADAADLSRAGARKLPALQEYVRSGGRLVVCQPEERYRIEAFADMLPVGLKGPDGRWLLEVRERADAEPLRSLSMERQEAVTAELQRDLDRSPNPPKLGAPADTWRLLQGPFKAAFATARPDAVVDLTIDWPPAEPGGQPVTSPYTARRAFGLGDVTWVAQDLSHPTLAGRGSSGWPYIWDRVFGWKTDTKVVKVADARTGESVWGRLREQWDAGGSSDLGFTLQSGTDHSGKAGAYVVLVILFFLGYWIVAGPGSYLFLAGKNQRQLSWTIFAVSALVATLLTVGLVKLVLRGTAEVRHLSVVRLAPGQPPIVDSRIGLYIPRDGLQEIALPDVAPNAVSTITALAQHPQHVQGETNFADTLEYTIPVRDAGAAGEGGGVAIDVPYRSTLKKLQIHRVGPLPDGIVGWAGLCLPDKDADGDKINDGYLEGQLTNATGHDLKNVFFAFNYQTYDGPPQDIVLYTPSWAKGARLDLLTAFASKSSSRVTPDEFSRLNSGSAKNLRGFLDLEWSPKLLASFRSGARDSELVNQGDRPVRTAMLVMSLFDRIRPMRNDRTASPQYSRNELLRRGGGRDLDLSHLVGAGELVILADAGDRAAPVPLPFPFDVDGDRVGGQGTIFYQIALPLKNRDALMAPPPPGTPPAATDPGAEPAPAADGAPGPEGPGRT